jgi:hypothetical protein
LKTSCSDFEKYVFLLKIALISREKHQLFTEFEHRDGIVIAGSRRLILAQCPTAHVDP